MLRVIALICSAATVQLLACTARADPGNAANAGNTSGHGAAAEALFRAGRAAASRSDNVHACRLFKESLAIQPAPGTLLNLAVCERNQKHLAEAWRFYEEAVHILPDDDPRWKLASAGLHELESQLAWVTIMPPPRDVPGMRVELQHVPLSENGFGVAIPIDPGTLQWSISAPNNLPQTYTRTAVPGERTLIVLTPFITLAQSHAIAGFKKDTQAIRILAYSAFAIGTAALAAGGIAGVLALKEKSVVHESCPNNTCTERGWSAAESEKRLATISTLAIGFGLLNVGVGAFLLPQVYASTRGRGATAFATVGGRF